MIPVLRMKDHVLDLSSEGGLPRCAERLGVTVKVTAELVLQQLHKAAKGAAEGPPTWGILYLCDPSIAKHQPHKKKQKGQKVEIL